MAPPDRDAVSIVLPVRNAAAHVTVALDRLERQTAGPLEVVVVDDGSTDETASLVTAHRSRHEVHLVQVPESRGVAHARNVGLSRATGTFVWFADVDDDWSDRLVERLRDAAQSDGSDIALCRARQVWGDSDGARRLPADPRSGRLVGDDALGALLADTGALWNKLFRREVLANAPFPAMSSKSDRAGIAAIAGRVRSVSVVDEVLYTYVRHANSISNGGVVEPQNFLRALTMLEASLAGRTRTPGLADALELYRYDTYARTLREVWRFHPRLEDPDALVAEVRSRIRLSRALALARRDPVSAATCAAARVSPRLARRLIGAVGARLWVPHRRTGQPQGTSGGRT